MNKENEKINKFINIIKSGKIYDCNDDSIMDYQREAMERLYDFNNTRPGEVVKRQQLLQEMFGSLGKECYIEPPLRANWGGKNVHFGDYVYANFNLTLVDDADIFVGDYTLFAPNVTIATATHPVSPEYRSPVTQYNLPVKIGKNVWIGAGSIVLPGVTIGDNSVIGAGSVVTKDIPKNVVAFGNPCRVQRQISEKDREKAEEMFYKN